MAKRSKNSAINFRIKKNIQEDYNAVIEAMAAEDRHGRPVMIGTPLEWFVATFASATDKERAELLERLQDGMERWVAQHKAAPHGAAGPVHGRPPGNGKGKGKRGAG